MDNDDQDVVNSIVQNDVIEEVKIIGNLEKNDTIDDLLSSWNNILDKNSY